VNRKSEGEEPSHRTENQDLFAQTVFLQLTDECDTNDDSNEYNTNTAAVVVGKVKNQKIRGTTSRSSPAACTFLGTAKYGEVSGRENKARFHPQHWHASTCSRRCPRGLSMTISRAHATCSSVASLEQKTTFWGRVWKAKSAGRNRQPATHARLLDYGVPFCAP
jgi:hypothetical protein